MGIVQMLKEIPYRTECGTLLWISPHAKSSICLFCSSCVVPVNVHSDEQWTSYTVKFSFRWNDEYYVWVHDVALESRLCSVFSFVSGLRTPWYEYTLNTAHVCEHIVVPRIKKSTVHFNGNREHTRMHAHMYEKADRRLTCTSSLCTQATMSMYLCNWTLPTTVHTLCTPIELLNKL